MTTRHITYQPSLFSAALRFWSLSCNCFVFPFGHMTITLLDIFVITGLPILGDDTVCLIDESKYVETNISSKTYDTYPKVVSHYLPLTGEPSAEEHIAFLWVLICKYIFCPSSARPSMEYLPLAKALVHGDHIALGCVFLGSLYSNLRKTVSREPFHYLGGGAWFLQCWLLAYFPEFTNDLSASTILPLTNIGGTLVSSICKWEYDKILTFFMQSRNRENNKLSIFESPIDKPRWLEHFSSFSDLIYKNHSFLQG